MTRPRKEGLEEIEIEKQTEDEEPMHLHVRPERSFQGETIQFAVNPASNITPAPMFEIWKGGRRLREVRARFNHDEQSWVGTYRFRRAGRYEIRFLAPGQDTPLSSEVLVSRRARPPGRVPARRPESRPPPVMSVTPHMNDERIDWTIPDPPSMTSMNEPPAPWTG